MTEIACESKFVVYGDNLEKITLKADTAKKACSQAMRKGFAEVFVEIDGTEQTGRYVEICGQWVLV